MYSKAVTYSNCNQTIFTKIIKRSNKMNNLSSISNRITAKLTENSKDTYDTPGRNFPG